jgi:hypothetical protein
MLTKNRASITLLTLDFTTNIKKYQGGNFMLKAKFIDKILEVMQEEADRIWIDNKEVTVCFKDSKDVDGNAEILKHIYTLKLNEVMGEYKIRIDYEFKNIEIHKGTKFVCLRGFGKYGVTGIWSMILEEIEEDRNKMEEEQ